MEDQASPRIEFTEEHLTDPFFTEDLEATAAGRGSSNCFGPACQTMCTAGVPMPPRRD